MESSIECISISSIDGMDEDEISHPNNPFSLFSSPKPSLNNNVNGGVINPATSVHELLECPVCTNSMYPPIHQETIPIPRDEIKLVFDLENESRMRVKS
ncbi:E3 ubiquitin-protein ligase sinat5 [Phtheirospermum japonicum]|uniref:E3 ubiquitin-protein ligase sinat5 n=1 Tax=Phtheirospermum japonicum TaxID=374723 RepID=A0A830D2H2_9LAMI|nr:E3 ubiquitin-protein ligase sinat5 [Phtheirospermum japonicum]